MKHDDSWLLKVKPYQPKAGLPQAIIVDIDGTLAHKIPEERGGRDIFDYSRVHEDKVDEHVRHTVNIFADTGHHIIVCSGREDDCRDVTEKWLVDNLVHFDDLFMRKAGDYRKDNIIKYELFNTFVRDKYDIMVVLDDRDQVVDMWRRLGLSCYQVAYGNF